VQFTSELGLQNLLNCALDEEVPVDVRGLEALVVDDNATNRRILLAMLSRWHLNAIAVESGAAALQILERKTFDVMLLDIQMPEMDGFEVIEHLQQRRPPLPMKIMVLTSMGRRGNADRCMALNVHSYLNKPVKSSDLLRAIQALFRPVSIVPSGSRALITRHSLGESRSETRPVSRLTILLAEDNLVNQTLARRLLEKQGHTVVVAANGRLAVEAFESRQLDLILMDVQMPEMDGFEATEAIREREARTVRRRIPIVAMTARALTGDREQCLRAGMDGYITKPVGKSELLNVIDDAISAVRENAEAPPSHAESRTFIPTP